MNTCHLKSINSQPIDLFENKVSQKEMIYYYNYQQEILQILGWIETNSEWLWEILNRFLKTGYVHEKNKKQVLKTAIQVYYVSRANISYQISDKKLLNQMVACYVGLSGMSIETLGDRVSEIFKYQEGVL